MKDTELKHIDDQERGEGTPDLTMTRRHKRALWIRILAWTGGCLLGLVVLVVLALCGLTWWYNPTRLAALISKTASEQINADVALSEVKYTLWSSFPHLNLEIDTISLRSRNFDSIPASLRKDMPAGADRLLTAQKFKGSINLMPLFAGRIYVKDIQLDSLDVNLVALTDSLNNYEIIASGGKSKVPYFHIDGFSMNHSGRVAYTSVPTATNALVNLTTARLEPSHHVHHRDTYDLQLDGKVDVHSGQLTILQDFPFGLSGDVGVRFDPFGISTTDYKVALGDVKGEMTMEMNIGDAPRMDQFAYSLHNFTLGDLETFLPPGNYPVLEHLDADLALDASARLVSPYEFSSAWLPSIEVDFKVPEGHVSYHLSDGRKYEMDRVGLNGRLLFNGREPEASYVEIPEMFMSGDGISVNLAGKITDLTTTPGVTARMNAVADLGGVSKAVPELQPYQLTGDMGIDANVSFRLEGSTLYGALADLKLKSDSIGLKHSGTKVDVTGFEASTSESYADALTQGALLTRIPVSLNMKAKGLKVSDKATAMNMDASGVEAKASLSREGSGKVLRSLNLDTRTDAMRISTGKMNFGLRNLAVGLSGDRLSSPRKAAPFTIPAAWEHDERTRSNVAHTPEFVQLHLPARIKHLMELWQARLDVKAGGGRVGTSRYPGSTTVGPIDMTATFDSIALRQITLSSGRTKGTISANVSNLRQFLSSSVPAPLRIAVDADIDTIQINQLAREFAMRNPDSPISRGDKEAMAAGADSIALLIPRNVYADITASAKQTRYINLHLYDLYARMRIADGRADIDTVRIGSDFGHAGLHMAFDTGDMQNINLAGHLDINDVNVVNFFKNFHKLLVMWPQMKNFEGNLSAGVDMSMLVFPSMYLNVPSVRANAEVKAWGMTVHQSPFIQRVTRMLLLPGDEDLHIRNITLHAGVHNNLLEVFPFEFEMSKYRLILGGINNFNGELYYHVGVADWPLKIPFGINIEGDFHHPKLHFGGKSWHDKNGARIAIGVDDNTRINIMRMGMQYAGEFVHTAATYEGD